MWRLNDFRESPFVVYVTVFLLNGSTLHITWAHPPIWFCEVTVEFNTLVKFLTLKYKKKFNGMDSWENTWNFLNYKLGTF